MAKADDRITKIEKHLAALVRRLDELDKVLEVLFEDDHNRLTRLENALLPWDESEPPAVAKWLKSRKHDSEHQR